jgi:hypothetical protein
MAAIRPVMMTEVTDAELEPNRPVSEETVHKIIQNVNMMLALCPIGEVLPVEVNIAGVTLPIASVWQYADGGEITEPTSPLNGPGTQNVPNMVSKYPRGGTVGNTSGGSPTVDLSHTHTTDSPPFPGNLLEQGPDRFAFDFFHTHGIANDLNAEEPLDPAHMQCAYYFKIT